MAPLNAAAQMALANLLRGAQPQQQTPPPLGDVNAVVGALPPIPGLPGAQPPAPADMSEQMALANALGGNAAEQTPLPVQPPPSPMGPAATPPPAGQPPALTVPKNEPAPSSEPDFAQAMADALESQRTVAANLGRQRAAGNLGLLTGDRVLSNFGRAQLEQAETGDPNSLRYLSLIQAQQRLKQQADAEARKAGQVDKRLEFDREKEAQRIKEAAARLSRDAAAAKLKAEKDASKEALAREAELNKATTGLRKEFNDLPAVKGYDTVASSFDTFRNSYRDMSGPGAINTIFSFMKILDPNVAVMGGDVDLIRNSGGKAAQFAGLAQSVLDGNPLTAKTREDLYRQAVAQYESRRKQYDAARNKFEQIARRQNVDPNLIFLDRDDVRIGGNGGSPTGGPVRTTPSESMPTGADGNPTLDAPTPASTPQDGLPPIVSTIGMKPGDLARATEEGKRIRIRDPDKRGAYLTYEKRNGKLIRVREN